MGKGQTIQIMKSMKLPPTFSIFPVAGKKPLVEWGEYSNRLPTSQELESWKKYKEFGIATGPVSRILVLDDDGGLDLAKYPVPKTLTQKTPRGGTHYFFKWTDELEAKVTTKVGILEGVDVRGEGGFAVFYGFEKPHWIMPLALPPRWLVDLLPSKIRTPQIAEDADVSKSYIQGLLDDIKPGNRNDSFTRIAGSLRGRGYSIGDIFDLLAPKAREVDFGLEELRLLTESIGRYRPNEISEAIRPLEDGQANSIEEFLKDQETVEWIVPGMIAKKSIAFMVGLPETGKTWMSMDLAVESAKGGGLWLGKFPVKKAKVLFIDQERFKGETQRRLKAVIQGNGIKSAQLKDALFVRCGTTTRLDLQHSFEAFRKEVDEIRPDLIIIDSFATFHTKEENNRKDIQEVLERVKQIRNEFGCTFVFLHHENKMAFNKEEAGDPSISQMAGSIAIPAAAETVFTVRKIEDGSMVYHTKSTLSATVEPFMVKVTDQNEQQTSIKVEAY